MCHGLWRMALAPDRSEAGRGGGSLARTSTLARGLPEPIGVLAAERRARAGGSGVTDRRGRGAPGRRSARRRLLSPVGTSAGSAAVTVEGHGGGARGGGGGGGSEAAAVGRRRR